jgi:hypothetical protein
LRGLTPEWREAFFAGGHLNAFQRFSGFMNYAHDSIAEKRKNVFMKLKVTLVDKAC